MNVLNKASAALALAALLAVGTTVRAQEDDHLIVPGVRLGPVHLGITDVELYRQLGDPQSTQPNGDVSMNYTYSNFGVSVSTHTHKVIQVLALDASYATAEGIKVGSSHLAIAAKLGIPRGPCNRECTYYYKGGLGLGTTEDGSVRTIWVFDYDR
jgi:hypothetical protein